MKKLFVVVLCLLVLGACTNQRSNQQLASTEPAVSSDTQSSRRQIQSGSSGKPISIPAATPTSGGVPLMVHFTDGGSYGPDGDTIVSWEWNFADEQSGQGGWYDYTATAGDAWHTYTVAGNYTAHLRVTDDTGKKGIGHIQITLEDGLNANPIAVANVTPTYGTAPLEVSFSPTGSYDPDGSIVRWEWDLGDGIFQDFTATQGIISHTYTAGGTYTVILRVTDDDGAVGTSAGQPLETQPIPTWVHTWGTSGHDWGYGHAIDLQGNVYVVVSLSDVVVLKYSKEGSLVWHRAWGSAGYDDGQAIVYDPVSDTIWVTGTTSFGAGNGDVILLRYSADGELLLQKTWGGSEVDVGHDIALHPMSNTILVVGESVSPGGHLRSFILKYSATDGALIRARVGASLSGACWANAVTVDDMGNIYTTGYHPSGGDIFLTKMDSDCEKLWTKLWGGVPQGNDDSGEGVVVDHAGNIYVAGRNSHGPDWGNWILLKYTDTGDLLWVASWGTPSWDRAEAITLIGNGSVLMTGFINGSSSIPPDLAMVLYSADGMLSNQSRWSGGAYGQGFAVSESFGQIYLSGSLQYASGYWENTTFEEIIPEGVSRTDNIGTIVDFTGTEMVTNGSKPAGSISFTQDSGRGGRDALTMSIAMSQFGW